jgi:uncharacterized protein
MLAGMHPLTQYYPHALVVWGGWEGHQPQAVAERIESHLRRLNYQVQLVAGVDNLTDLDLASYDLIVPIWSWGITHPAAMRALLTAVEQGTGLATFHGGIDWFVDWEYARLIGGHFLYHPPSHRYAVAIADTHHAITHDLADFVVDTEQYYFHVDPGNQVLTTTRFDGLVMPNTWVRSFAAGRVFYCSLAHTLDVIEQPPVLQLLLRGMSWATRPL